jgi:hypothetical protein
MLTTSHRYGIATLTTDYVRAVTGFALTGGPVLFADLASVMLWLMGGLATLFLAFGLRTALRQASCIELSTRGVRVVGPFGATINWEDLRGVDVRYFSTKKDRTDGWMQLTLRGPRRRIRLDSGINGFADLTRCVVQAARAYRVPIDPASRANLGALGVSAPAGDEGR